MVARSFAYILNLPFFTLSNDDANVIQKVVWNGDLNPPSKAPPGPDCVICAFGFNCVLEMTRRTGANQWTLEGAPMIRHTNDVLTRNRWLSSNTYTVLVTTRIAMDTFNNFHRTRPEGIKVILLDIDALIKVLHTSILAISMRNIKVNNLMELVLDCMRRSPGLNFYNRSVESCVLQWRARVLESEKAVFVGLKALRAMKQIGRSPVGLSELYGKMLKNKWIKQYLNLINQELDFSIIQDSLLQQGFAECQPGMDDTLLYPVMTGDFINREKRIIDEVRRVGL